jgi:hypothetical protein
VFRMLVAVILLELVHLATAWFAGLSHVGPGWWPLLMRRAAPL